MPLVHLTESLEQVCASVTEANNLLPARPTLAIGQPVAVDPSRAPEGGWILWIQMQEMPARLKGDAGQIDTPADGRWNEAVREAYADRVQARLERVMRAGRGIVGRRAYSPADLETLNCNLVGGDPYSGICSPDQFASASCAASGGGARGTPVAGLYHRRVHPPRSRTGRAQARWSPGRSRGNSGPTPGPCHTFRRADPSARRDGRARRPPIAGDARHASQLPYQQQHTPWLGDKAMRKSMPAWALLLASALGPSAALAIEGGALPIYPDGLENYMVGALPRQACTS